MAGYQEFYRCGQLKARVAEAVARLANCSLCPRCCSVNRSVGELGKCRIAQSHPVNKAFDYLELSRPLLREEFREAIGMAQGQGLRRHGGRYSPPALRLLLS